MKPPVTLDCSLAPKLLFVDWLKILTNEKQQMQFRSPSVLICEQKRRSHMPYHQAKLFTSSFKLGYIPTAWKITILHMLLKPDKLPSLTTSYRPISLISSIMKLFERVIEQRLHSHLNQIGFIHKHQSGFTRAKSTDDHLFRLSQSIMESFNRGEHVVAAFPEVEKAFDNVWHNGLRYKIFMVELPTKMTRWLSDFLVGHVIQVNVNGFLSNQMSPKQEFHRVLS